MKYSPFILTMLVASLVGSGVCAKFSQPYFTASEQLKSEEIESAKESIALSLLGQVQFTVGSMVWLKTLEYLHNGVDFRMPTNTEEEHGQRASNSSGVVDSLSHQEGVAMTLSRKTDWRGIVGELHREIYPYMAEHSHSDPRELIPWYKLVTRFNPNLERMYVMGAFFMSDFAREPNEALAYLEEGAKVNPWSFEIHAALGRLYFDSFHDYGKALNALTKATEYGTAEQERLTKNKEHFDDYQKQLFKESFLFLAKSMTELNQYDSALKVCEKGYAATNASQLNVQKRITEKRQKGESDRSNELEAADQTSINSTLKSGIREETVSDEETGDSNEETDDVNSDEDSHSLWMILGFIGTALFLLFCLLLFFYRKTTVGMRFHFSSGRILFFAGGGILIALAGYIYTIWPESMPVFSSDKEEATYYRDRLDQKASRYAANFVQAGNDAWGSALTAEGTNAFVESGKMYAVAASNYRNAIATARNALRNRKLIFPDDKCLGKVSIRPWGKQKTWEKIGKAQGSVSIPALHEVNLDMEGQVTSTELKMLAKLGDAAIQSLSINDKQITEAALSVLLEIQGLRNLSLYGTEITDREIAIIGQINSLETLNIGHTHVTDAGLKALSRLRVLKTLSLAETQITDAGIATLKQLPALTTLWLTGTKIGEIGIDQLKDMTRLRVLWLGNTQLSDASLPSLVQLSSLKELWIGSNVLSEKCLETLRKTLPNCRILD